MKTLGGASDRDHTESALLRSKLVAVKTKDINCSREICIKIFQQGVVEDVGWENL